MKPILCIFDFGHGTRQYTSGKRSPDETLFEGEWNREVGRMIVKALEELNIKCSIIVPEDQDIPLQTRCNRANEIVKNNPEYQCVYISVHIDAAPTEGWSNASGMSVYVHTNATGESVRIAKCFYDSVKEFGLQGNRSVPKECFWRADYKVLRSTICPAVLVEDLFMTNKKDCEFLKSKKGKETITNLYVVSLCKYIGIPYGINK